MAFAADALPAAALPPMMNLVSQMPPVKNQGLPNPNYFFVLTWYTLSMWRAYCA